MDSYVSNGPIDITLIATGNSVNVHILVPMIIGTITMEHEILTLTIDEENCENADNYCHDTIEDDTNLVDVSHVSKYCDKRPTPL